MRFPCKSWVLLGKLCLLDGPEGGTKGSLKRWWWDFSPAVFALLWKHFRIRNVPPEVFAGRRRRRIRRFNVSNSWERDIREVLWRIFVSCCTGTVYIYFYDYDVFVKLYFNFNFFLCVTLVTLGRVFDGFWGYKCLRNNKSNTLINESDLICFAFSVLNRTFFYFLFINYIITIITRNPNYGFKIIRLSYIIGFEKIITYWK